jgi:hypothetical protein
VVDFGKVRRLGGKRERARLKGGRYESRYKDPPFAKRREGRGTRKFKGKCQSEERFLASLGMTILGGQLSRTCTFGQAANRLAKCYG